MASSEDPSWMDDVRKKLIDVFGQRRAEDLTRILFYLDQEDKTYKDDPRIPPAWKTLNSTMYSDEVFKAYAEHLAEDTRRAENDELFRKTMAFLYSQMMEASEEPLPEDHAQGFDMVRLGDVDLGTKSGFMGLARAWSLIPRSSQAEILVLIPKIVANKHVLTAVDEVVSLVNKTGGTVVMVTLAAIHLSYETMINLYRWWKGEITGKRCAKNILDATFTIGAGVGGGLGGAALGSISGPMETVAGGIIGGMLSSSIMNVLSDSWTQKLFGIPKEEALENAYNFLGVKMTASNHEINTAFRKLCLKYHPDKPGGSKEDFFFLQLNMGTIKAARGELF